MKAAKHTVNLLWSLIIRFENNVETLGKVRQNWITGLTGDEFLVGGGGGGWGQGNSSSANQVRKGEVDTIKCKIVGASCN